MVYSKHERPHVKQMHPGKNPAEISRVLGMMLREFSPNEQQKYRDESAALKKMHEGQFPYYKYTPKRTAARKRKYPAKGPTVKTATNTTITCQNLRAENISHLSASTANERPQLGRFLPKDQLQTEPMQPEILGESSVTPLRDVDQPLSFLSENEFADVIAGASAGEDAVMAWVVNINK